MAGASRREAIRWPSDMGGEVMTREFFDRQMTRLAVLRFPPADIESHWDALQDIPADVFTAAVSHALKTRRDFPVPAELRADADYVAWSVRPALEADAATRETTLEQPFTVTIPEVGTVVSITREWLYYDDHCSDTGWVSCWCGASDEPNRKSWFEVSRCSKRSEHPPHEWVQRCACWETNPALVRKREAQRKYAVSPQKVT